MVEEEVGGRGWGLGGEVALQKRGVLWSNSSRTSSSPPRLPPSVLCCSFLTMTGISSWHQIYISPFPPPHLVIELPFSDWHVTTQNSLPSSGQMGCRQKCYVWFLEIGATLWIWWSNKRESWASDDHGGGRPAPEFLSLDFVDIRGKQTPLKSYCYFGFLSHITKPNPMWHAQKWNNTIPSRRPSSFYY